MQLVQPVKCRLQSTLQGMQQACPSLQGMQPINTSCNPLFDPLPASHSPTCITQYLLLPTCRTPALYNTHSPTCITVAHYPLLTLYTIHAPAHISCTKPSVDCDVVKMGDLQVGTPCKVGKQHYQLPFEMPAATKNAFQANIELDVRVCTFSSVQKPVISG